jgi:hypothetical protein
MACSPDVVLARARKGFSIASQHEDKSLKSALLEWSPLLAGFSGVGTVGKRALSGVDEEGMKEVSVVTLSTSAGFRADAHVVLGHMT